MGTTIPRDDRKPGGPPPVPPQYPRCDVSGAFSGEPINSDAVAAPDVVGVLRAVGGEVAVTVGGVTVAHVTDADVAAQLLECLRRHFQYEARPVDGNWWMLEIGLGSVTP